MSEAVLVGVTDPELEWCRSHRHIPQANTLLERYSQFFLGPHTSKANDRRLAEATLDLRKLMGRPVLRMDHLYAYVNPSAPRGGEDVPAFVEDGEITTLCGADLARMRSMLRDVRKVEAHLGFKLEPNRYENGEALSLDAVRALSVQPYSGRVDRLYAMVGTDEHGDETVCSYPTPHALVTPLIFTRCDSIAPALGAIEERWASSTQFRVYVNRQPFDPGRR